MTILNFFYLSLFLYDDIGRGQLNMQLNKSDDDDDDDDGGDGGEEEENQEEVEDKEEEEAGDEGGICVSDNDGK